MANRILVPLAYQTLVWALERDTEVAIALIYGSDADWVKNLLAAGEGEMTLGGESILLSNARLVGDEEGVALIPAPVRYALQMLDVHDFVLADRVETSRYSRSPTIGVERDRGCHRPVRRSR
ncbi:MAG: hypothetical protein OEM97_03605 [Acidimicrobiia bacterium]|nr:hypothetical protein [Acidimicrobiia bacterium]